MNVDKILIRKYSYDLYTFKENYYTIIHSLLSNLLAVVSIVTKKQIWLFIKD